MSDRSPKTRSFVNSGWPNAALSWAWACALLGCAGTPAAFSSSFRDNQPTEVATMLERVEASPERRPGTIAVGAAPGSVYGYDLEQRKLVWRHALDASSAPLLAGGNALVQVGDDIVGFDVATGERSFRIDARRMSLQGADGEGDATVFTLGSGQGTQARAEVVLVRGGSTAWRLPIQGQGGAPALAGEIVLVPWSTQFLSALELEDGAELARLRVRDGVISHALRGASGTFIGSHQGLARLSSAITSGSLKRAGLLQAPPRELPGRPALVPDIHEQSRSPVRLDSAEHRIGLAFQPTQLRNGAVGTQDDALYYYFYRFVFGLDPRHGTVRWVRVLEADIVGARAVRRGVAIGDERGRIFVLSAASGETRFRASSTVASSVLRLPAGGFGNLDPGRPPSARGLRAQLVAAISDTDARLAPAREFAVQQLAQLPQPEVTADLVALCDTEGLTALVRERACIELKNRPQGSEAILLTLARHAGQLEGTNSPPVGALASAAASVKLTQAVPHLIAHLADPATRSADLPALIAALGELGDTSAVPALSDFLELYHADPIDPQLVRALQLVPAALLKLRAKAAQSILARVASDELGIHSVREQARAGSEAFSQPPPAPAPAAAETTAADAAQASGDEAPAQPGAPLGEDAIPPRLTSALVEAALQPVQQQLQECLTQSSPSVLQARIVLVVSDGHAQTVSVIPAEAQDCMAPLVKAQPFPATAARTPERLSYTLKR